MCGELGRQALDKPQILCRRTAIGAGKVPVSAINRDTEMLDDYPKPHRADRPTCHIKLSRSGFVQVAGPGLNGRSGTMIAFARISRDTSPLGAFSTSKSEPGRYPPFGAQFPGLFSPRKASNKRLREDR